MKQRWSLKEEQWFLGEAQGSNPFASPEAEAEARRAWEADNAAILAELPWSALQARAGGALDPGPADAGTAPGAGSPAGRAGAQQAPRPSALPRGWRLWTGAGAGLFGAVAALWILFAGPLPTAEPTWDGLKSGGPALLVYRLGSTGPELVSEGSKARAGDRLQLAFRPAGFTQGLVFSVDGRGVMTLHHAGAGEQSRPLGNSVPLQTLSNSYELDAAPAFERFYLVLARRPFRLNELTLNSANLPEAWAQDLTVLYLTLNKD